MASYEHARKTITEMYEYWKENRMSFHELKALEKSIEALERQIPRVMEYNNEDLLTCPICGGYVNVVDNYCRSCGKAIYYDMNKRSNRL